MVGVADKGEHLVKWACGVGYDKAQQIKRDAAARGTVVHGYIQDYLNTSKDPENIQPKLAGYYESFKKACAELFPGHDAKKFIEAMVVSVKFGYSGCVDLVIEVDGKLVLIDWKTSGSIYPEYALQTMAYVVAWNESHPRSERIAERWVIRLAEDGSWEKSSKYFKSYDRWQDPLDFAGFLGLLDAFRWKYREQFFDKDD